MLDRPPAERLEHRLVEAGDLAALHGDAGQGADDRLGHRVEEMRHAGAKRRVVRVDDDPAMADDQQAVHVAPGAELDQVGERGRANALRFRRRDFPAGGRPGHAGRVLGRVYGTGKEKMPGECQQRGEEVARRAQRRSVHGRPSAREGPRLRLPSARRRPTTPLGK